MPTSLQLERLAGVVSALRSQPEQRAVYRMAPDQADAVVCRLHVGRAAASVLLVDISAEGAHIFVSRGACASLQEGAVAARPLIHLSLEAPGLSIPMRLTARVRNRRPLKGGVHVHLAFTETVRCGADVDARLRGLFNRRSALRVDAPTTPAVGVRLAIGGARMPLAGILVDASLTGVGLAVQAPPGFEPPCGARVSVILRLPEARAAASLRGKVARSRSVGASGETVHLVGVGFGTAIGDGCRASRDLARYVVSRQLEARETRG